MAYIGEFKIVGIAHFGVGQRASSRRPSDYIRAFSDSRLTLSKVRIYGKGRQDLLETAPFIILNLDKVDFLYAREDARRAGGVRVAADRRDVRGSTSSSRRRASSSASRTAPWRSCRSIARRRRSSSTATLRERRPVVGMTTFPNTVLLRGPRTILVDPGLPLQNDPVLRALEARGLSAADVDLVVLTHAHLDHAGGCASVMAPVAVHELETAVAVLGARRGTARAAAARAAHRRRRRAGARRRVGAHAGALRRAHQPGRRDRPGEGGAVRRHHRARPGRVRRHGARRPGGRTLLASWRRIRAWEPALIVAGHLPPFAP